MTNAAPAAARAAAAAAHAAADAVVAAPAAATALPTAMGVAKDIDGSPSRRLDAKFFSGQDESVWTLVTDLSTGTDRPLVTEMRRLSIITGAGRVLVMGAYTGPDGSVERRTSSYAKTPKG